MKKKVLILFVAMVMLFALAAPLASSAQVIRYDRTIFTRYNDALIPSVEQGRITSRFFWHGNRTTNRLTSDRSITVSTTAMKNHGFDQITREWQWFNTSTAGGTGYGVVSHRFFTGINVFGLVIGTTRHGHHGLIVHANGVSEVVWP